VQVQVRQPRQLLAALREAHVDADGREALGRVAATHEQDHVFLYADSREVAERAGEVVQATMDERGIEGTLTVWRWHPLEERWEDASRALPSTAAERAAEHARLIEREDSESRQAGYAEWEVRVTLPTHHDAIALARRLHDEGTQVERRWRHLLLGAEDEEQAQALAERVRREAPAGSDVHAEGVGQPIWEAMHPFAVFGGIAN